MRILSRLNPAVRLVISTSVILFCGVVCFQTAWNIDSDGRDAQPLQLNPVAAPATETSDEVLEDIPSDQAKVYRGLRKKVKLDFEKVSAQKVLKDLSETMGVPIKFEHEPAVFLDAKKETVPAGRPPRDAVTIVRKEPMTVYQAIFLVLQQGIGHQYQITLQDGGVLILDPVYPTEAEPDRKETRSVLRRHPITFSNYTTDQRGGYISKIKREVDGKWGQPGGGWIAPSVDIFSIDVFAPLDVHQQVAVRVTPQPSPEDQAWLEAHWQKIGNMYLKKDQEVTEEMKEKVAYLKKLFPYESLKDRLKYEADAKAEELVLSEETRKRLDALESAIGSDVFARRGPWSTYYAESLKRLHEESVEDFISREGFGFSRITPPGPTYLTPKVTPRLAVTPDLNVPKGPEVALRTSGSVAASGPNASGDAALLPSRETLSEYHSLSEKNFVDPSRFGYVKDVEHVAGFTEHAFSGVPKIRDVDGSEYREEETEQWAVRKLELVSLLKHEKPAVYISAELPRMDELKEAPKRPLNDFEHSALERIQKGEDVISRASLNRIEMVGSLRAIDQCVKCHDVKRGQLLGAFSYELIRDPQIKLSE